MKSRKIQAELMDDPTLDADSHRQALKGLERLNRLSGSAGAVFAVLKRFAAGRDVPLRVLDIATGGGDVPIALAKLAVRSGLELRIEGCDVSPVALGVAAERAAAAKVDVGFFELDALADPIPPGYDIVMCNLFLHHLADEQIVILLRKMASGAMRGVIVNDLCRSRLNLALVWIGAQLVTRSDVVHVDGARSVRAALTRDELARAAGAAGMTGANVEPCFPCRMLLSWTRP